MRVDFFTQAELGRSGLTELSHNLWPTACQTCGELLGDETPTLVVVAFVDLTASLHHAACQRPRWTQVPLRTGTEHNSTSARLVGVPFGDPGCDPFLPTILVNPSHEMIKLEGDAAAGYRCATVAEWHDLGLRPPSQPIPLGPSSEMAVWVRDDAVIVRCGTRLWCVPGSPENQWVAAIRDSGEVVLAVSTGMEPMTMANPEQIKRVLRTGDVALVRVALERTISAPPIDGHAVMIESFGDESDETSWLPNHIPYTGPTYDPATGRFEMAIGMDGPQHWRLNTPGLGAANGIVAGPSGLGKTNMLRMVGIEAVASGRFGLAVADPFDRNGLRALFSSAAAEFAHTAKQTTAMLEHIAEWLTTRRDDGPMLNPTAESPGLIVLIDDAHLVLTDPSAAEAAETIAVHGPQLSVGLIVATESVDPASFGYRERLLRALCQTNCFVMSRTLFEALGPYRPQHQ